jgi:hypothetical protein
MSQQTTWRSYEEVAQRLIDARINDQGFVIIECRRHTKQGLSQEAVGGLAFRISDTGAAGGIIVSPLPLQSGAKLVAENQGIYEVQLSAESTTSDYVLRFLGRAFHGISINLISESAVTVQTTVIRASGSAA